MFCHLSFLASAPQSVEKGIISLTYRIECSTRELFADLFKRLVNLSFMPLLQSVPGICVYVSQVVGVLLFPSSTKTDFLVKHSCHPSGPFWHLVFLAGRLTRRPTVSDEQKEDFLVQGCPDDRQPHTSRTCLGIFEGWTIKSRLGPERSRRTSPVIAGMVYVTIRKGPGRSPVHKQGAAATPLPLPPSPPLVSPL